MKKLDFIFIWKFLLGILLEIIASHSLINRLTTNIPII